MNCLMKAWHAHEVELRGWLRYKLGNAVDAEDLLQDIFIKAMRQGERFCAIANASSMLHGQLVSIISLWSGPIAALAARTCSTPVSCSLIAV